MSDISSAEYVLGAKQAPKDRDVAGPFDVAEAVDVKPYVDLGGILVPPQPGLEIKLEVEESTNRVVAVSLQLAGSTLQIQAFAESRAEGIWDALLRQLIEQIVAQGGKYAETEGPVGKQLETEIMLPGSTRLERAIYVGVDGPRWFLRGVISGDATRSDVARKEIISLFRSVVVNRGEQPMPPKDLIPLRIPAPPVAQDIGN